MKLHLLCILLILPFGQLTSELECKTSAEIVSNLNGVLLLPSANMDITVCNTTAIAHGQPINLEAYQEYLKFRKNRGLQKIYSNTFSLLPNVKTLILAELDLSDLEPNSFLGLTNLEYLNLENNRITTLPPTVFDDTPNLVELNLENNRISHINEYQFSKLSNLKKLKLSKNQIGDLPKLWYEGLNNLAYLSLSENKLTKLAGGMFEGLVNLETLRCNDNMIRDCEPGCLSGLVSLKSLSLHSNGQIRSENVLAELQSLRNLKGLSLSFSDIECELLTAIKAWRDENNIDLIEISSNPIACRRY